MSSESAASSESVSNRHQDVAAEVLPDADQLYIGGEWVDPVDGESFDTIDPTTGDVLASLARGREADVDRAVDAAWTAFDEECSNYSPGRRQRILNTIADRIEENLEDLARIETLDTGKPIGEAQIDVRGAAEQFRFFAGIVRQNGGETMSQSSRSGTVVKEPYGVVGQITPWNFPILIASWKLAPALAAGNCSVFKPAEEASLTTLRLLELVDDVVPDGVVNVVTGYGEEAGEPITTHEGVRKVAFTGSTAVGKTVMKNAADHVADVTLELGGKSPVMVFPDADVDAAVRTISSAIFLNTGECCEAGSRLFVHDDIADEVAEGVVAAAEGMTMGDPLDDEVGLGPKVSQEQLDRTLEYVEKIRDADASILTGGDRPESDDLSDGYYVSPTVVEGLDHDHEAVQDEIFGPLLEVFRWDDYDEMIALANDVDYGLAAGVVTNDVKQANKTARDVEAGYVWVNTYHELVPGLPFGGYKQSGIGRELGAETLEHYQQSKTINLSLR